jgi:protein SCO1/2
MRTPRLIAAFLAALLAACSGKGQPESKLALELRPIGNLAEFSLQDQDGQIFGKDQMMAKLWVVKFFFTRCPSICPLLTTSMKDVASHWSEETGIHFLSITVDADFDQVDVLKAFAEANELPENRWRLLSGKPSAIRELCEKSFLLALGGAMKPNGDITHSSRFVVVDGKGQVRGFFDGLDGNEVAKLNRALRFLLKEN